MDKEIVLFLINGLLAVIAFFAVMTLRDLSSAIKELRVADTALNDKITAISLATIKHDDLRDLRVEVREGFQRIHARIDEMTGKYVLRTECDSCKGH